MAAILLAWTGEESVKKKAFHPAAYITFLSFCQKEITVNLCIVTLQEKESVFLLDDKRISEINMVSGHTKKRTPKLHPLLNSVVTMVSSHNGECNL